LTTGNPLPLRSLTAPLEPSVWYLARCCVSGCLVMMSCTRPSRLVLLSWVLRVTGPTGGRRAWRASAGSPDVARVAGRTPDRTSVVMSW